jgi:hypothetical protein
VWHATKINLLFEDEAAHEKTHKDTDNFVTVALMNRLNTQIP